jgi:hypothetical protein
MSNKRWIVLALALAIVVLPMDARSQNEATDINVKDLTGHLDLSIPQSPAFTMLGVSPDEIVQSDDFRTVALGLLRGLDPRGNLQEGVALDTRPYMLIAGETATLAEYRTDPFVRIISNAQLSFATTSGSSDSDQADRLGLGLRLRLWREHDPAVGDSQIEYVSPGGAAGGVKVTGPLKNCYTDYLKAAVNVDPEVLPEDDAELDKIEQNLAAGARKTVEQCLAPFKRRYWNAGMLEIGVGGSRVTIDAMKESGSAAWLGFSHSIGTHGQVIVRAAYAEDRLDPVEGQAGTFQLVDETDAGARFRFGSERGTLMVEGLWTETKTATQQERYWRASLGTEFEVFKDIWIQLAVGKAFSTDLFDDDPVYSGQFRLGFSEKSLLAKD